VVGLKLGLCGGDHPLFGFALAKCELEQETIFDFTSFLN
jgi:hypothetical protein